MLGSSGKAALIAAPNTPSIMPRMSKACVRTRLFSSARFWNKKKKIIYLLKVSVTHLKLCLCMCQPMQMDIPAADELMYFVLFIVEFNNTFNTKKVI